MADEKKVEMSRRSFLRNAAVGAAVVGAVVAAPNVVALTQNVGGTGSAGSGGDAGSPMVAYVKDASTGTVVVMWGSKESEIKDPTLVSRIMRYTRG